MDANIQRRVRRFTRNGLSSFFFLRRDILAYISSNTYIRARVCANYRATIYFHENLVSFFTLGRVGKPTVALEELIIKSKQGEVLEKT